MPQPPDSALHYPFADTLPAPGTTLELAAGVRWLRMPLPFALDHINLWLLRDQQDGIEGWSIVDCGIDNEATRALWEQVFASELQGLPVLRVIVTHMHPDHIGLAHWLTERWSGQAASVGASAPGAGPSQAGASPPGGQRSGEAASVGASGPGAGPSQAGASPLGGQRSGEAASVGAHDCRLWISATDWNAARVASQATTGFGGEHAAAFFALHGLTDPDALAQVRARSGYYAGMVPAVPRTYRRLMDGMTLAIGRRRWRCIAGYGHAPEHIALHAEDDGLLIAGDMVLPRISTNVSVIDIEPEADPLPLYLASIARLRALPAETLVLPSHGKPFSGLHTRIDQLTAHHDERLADALAACTERPHSAAELLPVLFRRPLDLHQTTFAMGESVAHLHALASRGQLVPRRGDDGVIRWATAG